VEQFEENLKP